MLKELKSNLNKKKFLYSRLLQTFEILPNQKQINLQQEDQPNNLSGTLKDRKVSPLTTA